MADRTDIPQPDTDRHPLDLLAEEFADRCRRGEHPTVSDYAHRYPQYAEQLRQLLPPIALMEKLKHRNASGAASSGLATAPLKLERLGDFRIVREVGRGGMGIVYEATQESLGRRVALKVLSRSSHLDPQRVQRFDREAKAAAALHHTNIVPVFGVGEDEGLHYFVMQFIEGRSLAEVIASLAGDDHPGAHRSTATSASTKARAPAPPAASTEPNGDDASPMIQPAFPPRGKRYWQWVADVGRQVADALEYAHRQGVLHRDVKPGNLLLDERGNVWVTDFGLAKRAEHHNVTQTGDVVGTLQYLAPEGLRSQADARSDVYGLGLTLYEMLTLRPAFDEPHPAALMRRLAEGDLAPPRKVAAAIPADLETIILKAVARDPDRRYATAGDLAEDLENFLHDRAINARRAGIPERLWRWCRRNRAIAVLAALAITCALVAIVVGWTAYGATRRALAAEAQRRGEAEAARRRADENIELSLKGFQEIFKQLAADDTQPPPVPWIAGESPSPRDRAAASPREAALLQGILSFFDRFSQQNATNPALQAEAGKAYRRVGDACLRLGQWTESDAAYRRAATIFDQLAGTRGGNLEYRAAFVDSAIWVGMRDPQTLSAEDARLIHRATEVADELVRQRPDDPRLLELAARAMLREGSRLRQQKELASAEATLTRALDLWQQFAAPDHDRGGDRGSDHGGGERRPGSPPRAPEGSAIQIALAELLVDTKRPDEARQRLQLAWDELQAAPLGPRGGGGRSALVYDKLASVATTAEMHDLASRARLRATEIRAQRQPPESHPNGRFAPGGPNRPEGPNGPGGPPGAEVPGRPQQRPPREP